MDKLIFISSVICFLSCREPFEVNSINSNQTLVVEGFITNELKNHAVSLSYSTPIDSVTFIPETGANVSLVNGDGIRYDYTESVDAGIYHSPVFAGIAGQSYTLLIETRAGENFRSKTVIQKKVAEIDKLTARFIRNNNVEGVELYVNSLPAGSEISRYYKWEWIETYERGVPFPSKIIWTNRNNIINREEQVASCWASKRNKSLYIKTSEDLSENQILNFPVKFIPNGSVELSIRYSLLLRQYSLDLNGYRYWKLLDDIIYKQGSLSEIQFGNLPGNIISDGNQPVLGYFDASDVAEKRIFVDLEQFADSGFNAPPNYDFCTIKEVAPEEIGDFMSQNRNSYVIHKRLETDPNDPAKLTGWAVVKSICGDCREFGITNVKPEFW
ncbi:MAG: DUF4249 domain-containing protein [Cyclobacteriaceae bacterium]